MAVTISISKLTQNSQSVANNTSNVTVTVTCHWTYGSWNHYGNANGWVKIDGTKYTFSGVIINANKTTSGSQTLITKTVDVAHNSDGTKTLSVSASFDTDMNKSGVQTASASKTLTTIPRKSSVSVANGTLNTAQTISVTRQSSSFTHTITYKCGSATGTVCTKSTSTSISWTPPLSLANQNTTGTSVSATFTITTYNGDTSLGTNTDTATFTIPSSVKPSCTISVSDPTGYLTTFGGYIKGKSKMAVQVTPTTSYGSAIKSYKTTANGATYTTASFTTDAISSSGTLTISASVTDGRARSGSASTTITVLNYTAPSISKLAVARCNSDGSSNSGGDHVKVTFSYTATSLNSKNVVTPTLKYRKSTDEEYSTASISVDDIYSVTNETYIFSADTGSSYDVELTVTDSFDSVERRTSASTAFTLMHWNADGTGMAIGKVSEESNILEIALIARMKKQLVFDDPAFGIVGVRSDDSRYQQFQPINTSGDCSVGYGMYNAGLGNTRVYGNKLYLYSKNGIDVNDTVRLPNGAALSGYNASGEARRLAHINSNNNIVFGYGSYENSEGGVYIYGNDVNIVSKNDINVNNDMAFDNGCGIFVKNSSGTLRWLAMKNSSNQDFFGYGGYSASEGAAYYDGNTVNIRSKGHVYITAPSSKQSARAYGVNKVLWSGGSYMTASQTATLSEAVTAQPHGIVLLWSYYSDSTVRNYNWNSVFVPKYFVANHAGQGLSSFMITGGGAEASNKYLYISDTSITGADNNTGSTTGASITLSRNNFVLRYVIGV